MPDPSQQQPRERYYAMPILVIGSTGQVGSKVVNQLLRRNVEVRDVLW